MLLVSFTGLSYMLFRRLNALPAAAASLGILCFFGADSYLALTYTKTAGIATVGGINLMLLASEEQGGVKKWLPMALGAATVLFGLMMRDKEFAACAALMVPLGLWLLTERSRLAPAGRRLKAAAAFSLPFVLTIVIAAGLFLGNELIWDNSEYSAYKQFNAQRSRFVDYNVPEYEQMPEVYESLGIDEDMRDMFMVNCYERSVWTGVTYEALSEARDQAVKNPSLGECLGVFLDRCLSAFFIQKPIYGLLSALVLWLAWGRRELAAFLSAGMAIALFGLVYMFLIYQGRYLVNRTDAGFFFALAVTLLWFLSPQKAKGEGILCLLLILLCFGLGYQHIQPTGTGDAQPLRLQKQGGAGGIVHRIQHALTVREGLQVHRCLTVIGVHAQRGGIDDYPGVGVLLKVIVVILTAAGYDGDAAGPQPFQHRHHGDGGTAAAQHQGLFATDIYAAFLHQALKAVGVGVVPKEAAVRAADYGVHAAYLFSQGAQLPAVGQHSFLIGNGDVYSVPVPVEKEVLQLFRLTLKELIAVVGEHTMDGRGVAVAQLPA